MKSCVSLILQKCSLYLICLVLVACGGGGGGGGTPPEPVDPGNPSDPINPTNPSNPSNPPNPSNPGRGVDSVTGSVSGAVLGVKGIDVDLDTNDPASGKKTNNVFDDAQAINSVTLLHGFVSAKGTEKQGDRFADSADEWDVFSTTLKKGQLIQLKIVDWNQSDKLDDKSFSGDMDVFLITWNGNLVGGTASVSDLKSLQVPEDGGYFVAVNATAGQSKYVMEITTPKTKGLMSAESGGVDFVANEIIVKYKQSVPFNGMSLNSDSVNSLQSQQSHHYSDRAALVTLQPPQDMIRAMGMQASNAQSSDVLASLRRNDPEGYAKYLTLRAVKAYRENPAVEYVSPNYVDHALAVPDDTYYSLQWHYPLISLPEAWDITVGERAPNPVVVAVVDTGVVLDLPDIQGQLVPGYDFIRSSSSSLDGDGIDDNPDDVGDGGEPGKSSWHGTHVAGTIAAKTNNGAGVAGVAWAAKVMPIRVLGKGGQGSHYDIIQGILYAAGLPNDSNTVPERKADIINMSLGGYQHNPAYQDAVKRARDAGVIVIAAASNDDIADPSYPASYPGVVSVSAVDLNKKRAPYSNFGPHVDVAAPGGDVTVNLNGDNYKDGVLSLLADDTGGNGERVEIYAFYDGTSMATPHVAGVAALMRAIYPDLTPDQFDALLGEGSIVDDLGDAGRDDMFGYGLINAFKAVQAAQALVGGGDVEAFANVTAIPSMFDLGTIESEVKFTVYKEGAADLKISSITAKEDWLKVTPEAVDDNGLGRYRVNVNRSGLKNGLYQVEVTVNGDNGATFPVTILLQQGSTPVEGHLAQPYVFLIDKTTEEATHGVVAQQVEKRWQYQFTGIPAGEYYVISSSDIDRDQRYCVAGEVCGSYVENQQSATVQISNQALSDVDVVVGVVLGDGTNKRAAMLNAVER